MNNPVITRKGWTVDGEKPLIVDTLKPEWKTYVLALLDGENQTKAYMRAYPSASYETARTNGARLRHNARIRDAINELLDRSTEACYQDLVSLQRKALSVLMRATEGDKIDPTQLAAAKDILDRTGLIRRAGLNVKAEKDWESTAELLDD